MANQPAAEFVKGKTNLSKGRMVIAGCSSDKEMVLKVSVSPYLCNSSAFIPVIKLEISGGIPFR